MERYKPREDWTTAEIVRHKRTGEKPERHEYVERKIELLRSDGFDAEADELEARTDNEQVAVGDMTPDQHLARIQEEHR